MASAIFLMTITRLRVPGGIGTQHGSEHPCMTRVSQVQKLVQDRLSPGTLCLIQERRAERQPSLLYLALGGYLSPRPAEPLFPPHFSAFP